MSPTLGGWERECGEQSRPRFNLLRCHLWDRSVSRRVISWGETLGERYGDRPEAVLTAYGELRELYRRWLKGSAWCDKPENWGHPLHAERVEEAMARARTIGQWGDDVADWLSCTTGELIEMLDYDLARGEAVA